jgi:hypothetical protein
MQDELFYSTCSKSLSQSQKVFFWYYTSIKRCVSWTMCPWTMRLLDNVSLDDASLGQCVPGRCVPWPMRPWPKSHTGDG